MDFQLNYHSSRECELFLLKFGLSLYEELEEFVPGIHRAASPFLALGFALSTLVVRISHVVEPLLKGLAHLFCFPFSDSSYDDGFKISAAADRPTTR